MDKRCGRTFEKVSQGKISESSVIAALPSMVENRKRNKLWIPRLIDYLNTYPNESIVIIVGAAHFIGSEGILKLLSDKGFTIRPFSIAAMGEKEIQTTQEKSSEGEK